MIRKSPDAFRTISEVAEILDIPAHVLRFWESRFSQIKPVKRGGGRRYYRPQDIDLLRGIRDLLYRDGLTIKGVQKVLREKGQKHVVAIGHLPPEADPVMAPSESPADEAPAPRPEAEAETLVAERPAARQKPDGNSDEALRPFPEIDLPRPGRHRSARGETQFDLFAHAAARNRKPFPPDPEQAARKDALRALLVKLEALRAKMAQGD